MHVYDVLKKIVQVILNVSLKKYLDLLHEIIF